MIDKTNQPFHIGYLMPGPVLSLSPYIYIYIYMQFLNEQIDSNMVGWLGFMAYQPL